MICETLKRMLITDPKETVNIINNSYEGISQELFDEIESNICKKDYNIIFIDGFIGMKLL